MNFIISMQAEARPLIDKFRLTKRNLPSPFPVFESKLHKVIISGIGRMQAAAATGGNRSAAAANIATLAAILAN